MVHAAAVRAWVEARGGPPVNVKVIIEGEEETGSPHLARFLERHADDLRADVVVATDLVNWRVGVPGITYALRGLAEVYITVRALEQPVHSGMWGGAVPDALTGLIRTLDSLTDVAGRVAVPGLGDDIREPSAEERRRIAQLGADPDELRRDVRMLDGVDFVGDPELPLLERIWMRPTVNVIGIDVPDVRSASNTLLAEARAKVSVRLAPGQDPDRAARVVADHLERNVPWGLHVETRAGHGGEAWVADPEGPAFAAARAALGAAFGTEPVLLGCGGSIPFVSPIQEALDAPCLLTGIEDPASNAHGEDESLHLEDFARAYVGEALLLDELSRRIPAERVTGSPG
jgi:cysteinylglycine-S-conjugate dipeptidase